LRLKVEGIKVEGFMCPNLSFVSASLVKNCGLEPFPVSLILQVPRGVFFFLNYVNVYYLSR
ncbi:hypothetical protein, partial [Pedobacter jamesrossensis]